MGIRFNARTNSIETDAASIDFTQPITTPASTTSLAGLNIAEAVAAPSAPVDGDVWVTAGGAFNVRLNGVTVDLAAGGGDVTKVGTPVNNQIGVWTGDGTIEGDANLVWDGTAHELTLSDGTDSILMQIVLNTFDIGGSGLSSIRLQPTNGQNSVVANAGGSVVLSYNNTPTFQTNINRSESLNAITSNSGGVERVLTVGDIEAGQPRLRYFFDATTTSGDPGSGQIRYNNATPASVTSLYINDTSDSGLNSDRVLNNLASGDILTLCDEQDGADYLVVSVNGAPTDNTGWWTIPVTVIHSGTLPTNVVNIDVQWFSQATGGGITGTVADNQIVTGTGASTVDSSANLTYDGTSVTVSSGTLPSSPSLELTSTRPVLVWDESDATADNGRWYAHASAEGWQLVAINDANSVSEAALTIDRTGTNIDSIDFITDAMTVFGGTTTHTTEFGLGASSKMSMEVGDNYVQFQMTDTSVDTSACNMWFDLDSASTGSHQFYWSDGGFGAAQVVWVMDENVYRFDGGLELIERADHGGTNVSGGRGQIWVKSSGGGGELMYTEGDWDVDYTVQNMMQASYRFDTATDATDPGAGDVKFNNATAGSVTNIYINDAESTGRDNDFMLGQIADGDLIKLRGPGISAGTPVWWIGTVNGSPTDNTGWWTIPVTHVANSGSVFNSGYPVQIDIDFLSTLDRVSTGIEVRSAGNTDTEARLLEFTYSNGSLRAQIGHDGGATFELENRIHGGAIGMYAYDAGGLVRPIIVGDPDTDTDVTGDVNITLWNAAGVDKVLEGLANAATSIYYNGTATLQTADRTAAGNSSGADVLDGAGTFRPIGFNNTPQDTNNATNVPFTQAQVGYDIIHDNVTAYTWTTEASTGTAQTDIPAGSMWKCTNLGSGVITIAAGSGVTMYWLDGSGTTGNRSLAQWGTCTLYKYSNTQYHIWGTGLS